MLATSAAVLGGARGTQPLLAASASGPQGSDLAWLEGPTCATCGKPAALACSTCPRLSLPPAGVRRFWTAAWDMPASFVINEVMKLRDSPLETIRLPLNQVH